MVASRVNLEMFYVRNVSYGSSAHINCQILSVSYSMIVAYAHTSYKMAWPIFNIVVLFLSLLEMLNPFLAGSKVAALW